MNKNKEKLTELKTRLNELYDAYEKVDREIKTIYANTKSITAPYEDRMLLEQEINVVRNEIELLENT